MSIFKLIPYTMADKLITIEGPNINIMIDYDDVEHRLVDKQTKLLIDILNSNSEEFLKSEGVYWCLNESKNY